MARNSTSPHTASTGSNRADRRRPDRPVGGRRYVKMSEAAEYLDVTDRTIRAMVADGRLTGYRNGARLVRVDLNEIDQRMTSFGGLA